MGRLPKHVRALFWEGLAEEPDSERHAEYVAIRVLERGGEEEVRWLLDRFGLDWVQRVAQSGRLTARQAEFWGRVLTGA